MSIFKRKQKKEEVEETTAPASEQLDVPEQPEEEWVWVEGYKGTDANMCCRGYQYEIGKQYDMPDDEKIKECESGFHLCLKLDDVFGYYKIGEGNRFFKVKALVLLRDKESYGRYNWWSISSNDKLVAKSIVFVSELTRDEILKDTKVENLPEQYKDSAIKNSINDAIVEYHSKILIEDGYSAAFADSIIKSGLFKKAHAAGSQSDLSMDMKVLWILRG